jgi:DUF1009 family protein
LFHLTPAKAGHTFSQVRPSKNRQEAACGPKLAKMIPLQTGEEYVRMSESIGIIAGSGQFPRMVAQGARRGGLVPVICGFYGYTDPDLRAEAGDFTLVRLGQFGKMVRFFHGRSVRRLCFAGAVNKPRALDFRPDWAAAKILLSLRSRGDDALLRAVIVALEHEDFIVVNAADLAPGLLCPAGQIGACAPAQAVWSDIRYAWPIARALGGHDIGQTMVVKQGMVIAVECLEGTDAALSRAGELGGAGCTAVKICKPGQDTRVDLPSIGLQTLRTMARHNYACLAVSAGRTLFFDSAAALAEADRHNIAVVALEDDFA